MSMTSIGLPDASVLASNVADKAEAGPTGLPQTNMPMAQNIAHAVASGLVALPTTDQGWTSLIKEFESTGGPVPGAKPTSSNPSSQSPGFGQVSSGGGAAGGAGGGDVNSFLTAIRTHESSNDYTANSGDGAYGAYQFIPSTWNSEATAAGYSQYANGRADQAPPQVQDAVAAHMAQGYFQQFGGNFDMMARAWYDPAYVNDPSYAPPGNNGLTIGAYGQDIVNLMGQSPSQPQAQGTPTTSSGSTPVGAVGVATFAQSQIGTPYVWGGEDPSHPGHQGAFDCSGLVQAAYKSIGVNLPRVAQAQYDATPKLPNGAQLQPGDLVFFGSSTSSITHVGIYIGNGNMIDAPHTGAQVRVEPYHWADYVGATRPSDPGGQTMQGNPTQGTAQAAPTPTPTPTTNGSASAASLGAYYTALNQVVSALGKYLVGGQP